MLVPLGKYKCTENTEKHLQTSDGEHHGKNAQFVTAGYNADEHTSVQ